MSAGGSKRSLLDDIVEGARDILEALDRLINPGKRPTRAPVPIPVRPNPQRPDPRQR